MQDGDSGEDVEPEHSPFVTYVGGRCLATGTDVSYGTGGKGDITHPPSVIHWVQGRWSGGTKCTSGVGNQGRAHRMVRQSSLKRVVSKRASGRLKRSECEPQEQK